MILCVYSFGDGRNICCICTRTCIAQFTWAFTEHHFSSVPCNCHVNYSPKVKIGGNGPVLTRCVLAHPIGTLTHSLTHSHTCTLCLHTRTYTCTAGVPVGEKNTHQNELGASTRSEHEMHQHVLQLLVCQVQCDLHSSKHI